MWNKKSETGRLFVNLTTAITKALTEQVAEICTQKYNEVCAPQSNEYQALRQGDYDEENLDTTQHGNQDEIELSEIKEVAQTNATTANNNYSPVGSDIDEKRPGF